MFIQSHFCLSCVLSDCSDSKSGSLILGTLPYPFPAQASLRSSLRNSAGHGWQSPLVSHCSSHYRNLAVTIKDDSSAWWPHQASLLSVSLFLAPVLGISVGSRNWNSAEVSQAWAQLLCLSLALDNLCFRFYLFIFLQRSSLISHVPDYNTNNSDESCCHVLGTQPCARAPLVLFCTLCPSWGHLLKQIVLSSFCWWDNWCWWITVTFLRLLIHSVAIWVFSLVSRTL